MKRIIKRVLFGIAWGSTFFVIMGIIFAMINKEGVMFSGNEYIKQALCAILVGIGFSVPAVVYEKETLAKGLQMVIHMGIGLVIYFPVAYYAGWIPTKQGLMVMIVAISIAILISFIIWFGFYLYYKKEAKEMNQRIREKQQ